ncbi:MAG: 3-oxoacyl-ACP reductase FabG [Actinobacteria bacterium]|nr:3-oxoacyl-ACP reductase FabG [Actinomycetota bacterium]
MFREPLRLRGKVALVTGGARGIGQCFAQRLAADGAAVAVLDVAAADETLSLIKDAHNSTTFAARCDVTRPDQVTSAVRDALNALGQVDILVNNAGVYPAIALVDMGWEQWRHVLATNLDSVFHLTRAVLPGMIERGWGRIISVSSTTFHSGMPYNTHYTASKGGIIGFTSSLAAEVGASGVTVNTIAPGLIRTPGTEAGLPAELFARLAELQAIPRSGQPADLAGALSFLASDDAAYITGQTLHVDGGYTRT